MFQLDDEEDEKDRGEAADGVAKSKKKKKKKKKSSEEGAGQVVLNRCNFLHCLSELVFYCKIPKLNIISEKKLLFFFNFIYVHSFLCYNFMCVSLCP